MLGFFVCLPREIINIVEVEQFQTVTLHHADCHELLKTFGDNEFDLAICDPPYGIINGSLKSGKLGSGAKHSSGKGSIIYPTQYTRKSWDSKPFSREFFEQIFRVSKNWILWGAQHYADNIPSPHKASCYIVWDKDINSNFADFECAWTNFKSANRLFGYAWNGFRQGNLHGNSPQKELRVHPTQKPVALYEWILANYAKPGFRILDPTAGSGTCGIACIRAGLECTLIEQDEEYCGFIRNRLSAETGTLKLFGAAEIQEQIWFSGDE